MPIDNVGAKISRLRQLLNLLNGVNVTGYNPRLPPGAKSTMLREKWFLQDKITHTLKELKCQVQPDFIYEVTLNEYKHGSFRRYVQIIVASSKKEVEDYFGLVECITNTSIQIESIIEKPTCTRL